MTDQEWPPRPYDAITCRERLRYLRDEYYKARGIPEKINQGMKGALIGAMNVVFGEKYTQGKEKGDSTRHVVLGWIFGDGKVIKPKSTKELTDIEWYVIYKWINLVRVEDPHQDKIHWLPCNDFVTEGLHVAFTALDAFRKQENQFMQQLGFDEEALNG